MFIARTLGGGGVFRHCKYSINLLIKFNKTREKFRSVIRVLSILLAATTLSASAQKTNSKEHEFLWLVTCFRKPKILGSSPAASYTQRWALCNSNLANVRVSVKRVEVVERDKKITSLFPCSPVNREYLCSKPQIEKKVNPALQHVKTDFCSMMGEERLNLFVPEAPII